MQADLFDDRPCELGEGILWHPTRQQFFWFDIIGKRLLSQRRGEALHWDFNEHCSAAGWVDASTLLIASETGLYRFDIDTGARTLVHPLEADMPHTRSNDGRADAFGGFWIGTMGKQAEPRAGAIYRFHKGQLRRLFDQVSIPNAISFAPDGRTAYFCDTVRRRIMRQPLDDAGWPAVDPAVFVDLRDAGLNPDGAVVDADGGLWNAQWGAGRVARYLPDGRFDRAVDVGGRHASCPAFGGADLTQMVVTTAREGIADPDAAQGRTYCATPGVKGLPEHRVLL
ncbi:SMP-30/gluconolactonase/LRE family protein [Seohaeicola saemankumensis]|nr:SMP-30/gluconolactonase/LRE family protein [Seohaeicola saemankumensis]MCA0870683.1 SMP-30/gluconolactonase/LRE family protein [Seohaeicola saemankumensis]